MIADCLRSPSQEPAEIEHHEHDKRRNDLEQEIERGRSRRAIRPVREARYVCSKRHGGSALKTCSARSR